MCGITGIFQKTTNPLTLNDISLMTDAIRHRGPDDEGFVFFQTNQSVPQLFGGKDTPENVYASPLPYTPHVPFIGHLPEGARGVFGHRRLSILDLSPAGHQPMCNEDGTIWIVYNGEIYNFIELQHELKATGHHFTSHTDTEVILHAYEEWGEQCLDHFNGMWAFVLYDRRKNILFGARDRFGVKPLYYCNDPRCFAFASEIKALVTLPFIKKVINPEAVFNYLVLEINEPEEEGFFKRIFELLPSHALRYDLHGHTMKTWRYYTLPIIDTWETFDSQRCERHVTHIKALLLQAITLRLRSDVPVGSCLSGGIDSSSIVCMINSLLQHKTLHQIGERQKVFTASYNMEEIDESKWARLIVENTTTSWHQTYPTSAEFLEDLEDLVYTHDIPVGSTSIYAQYRVMRLAHEHGIKVLLDGQGGDELFTGYSSYYGTFFFEMLKNMAMIPFFRELTHLHNAPVTTKTVLLSLIRLGALRLLPDRVIAFQRQKNARKEQIYNYYAPDFWEASSQKVAGEKIRTTRTSVNSMLHLFMTDCKLSSLLRYEDRNSMRFSIESRTPFADDIHLIEAVFQIPSLYKIHNGWSKYLLRQAMKGIVPSAILSRKDKVGFATPEYFWLTELYQNFEAYLLPDLTEYLNVEALRRDWKNVIASQSAHGVTKVWRVISFMIWKKVYGI